MSFPRTHNIGAFLRSAFACVSTALTAAGSGDNTAIVGTIIDRTLFNYPLSCVLTILCRAVLAANKTLTIKTLILETGDASNLSDASTISSPADVVVLTDSGSGSTIATAQQYSFDLAAAKRYIRFTFTPDLNAGSVD